MKPQDKIFTELKKIIPELANWNNIINLKLEIETRTDRRPITLTITTGVVIFDELRLVESEFYLMEK